MLNLKHLRAQRGLTQNKLAEKIKLSRSTIAMYETGGSEPDLNTLDLIASTLDVSVDELLGRESKTSVVALTQNSENELSDNKKKLIEMVKDLNEDDVLIAMGIIARLNNKPLEEIYKNAK